MKQYQHLNKEERFYIWNSLRNGASQVDVARDLGRSHQRSAVKLGVIRTRNAK